MNKSGLNDFLLEIIHSEKVASVLAITTRDLSSFARVCEGSLKSLSIINLTHLDSNNAESCDLCVIFDDMPISKTQIGIIKNLSLIHISEPTRRRGISYAVFCLKKKKKKKKK